MHLEMNNRKGLSQILYLIIAASVLMMVAMVITFTATDVIGGAGGQATENTCTKALQGKCASVTGSSTRVTVPSTCVREGQFVGAAAGAVIYNDPTATGSGATCSNPTSCSGTTYISCAAV